MKTGSFLAAAMTLATLAGCATTAPPPKKVNLSQTCYGNLSAVPAVSLAPLSEELAKKLRARDYADLAKCLQSTDGSKSPVALYKLDGVQTPSIIKVMLTASSYGIFAAKATLLDQNFIEVSRTGFDKFINRGNTYTADVFVNSDQVRYLAVGPDDQQVGRSEKQYSSQASTAIIPAGPVFFVYTSSKDSVKELAFTDVGSLLVTVKPAVNAPILIKK